MTFLHYSAVLILLGSLIEVSNAQTRFEIADTVPNYAAYKYVDECLTAVQRLNNQVNIKDTIWRDTVPPDLRVSQNPVAPAAKAHGTTCLLKLNADTVAASIENLNLFVPVLLMIDRDADAMRLVARLLDSSTTAAEWSNAYELARRMYMQARPVRIDALKHLLQRSSPYETQKEGTLRKLMMNVQVGIAAQALGDTVLPRRVVDEVLKYLESHGVETKSSDQRSFQDAAFPLMVEVLFDNGIDSLTHSTLAYRKFLENLWSKMTTDPFEVSREAIGEVAPAITGKYWYRNTWTLAQSGIQFSREVAPVEAHVVPVPGKVNAIALLNGGCHSATFPRFVAGRETLGNRGECWSIAALLKRLKRQFPNLEITVVSRTMGFFGNSQSLTPDEESKMLSDYFVGFLQIPATQIVTETEFIRMQGLDRRRLDIEGALQEDYQSIAKQGNIILVDEEGKIFHNMTAFQSYERMEWMLKKKLQAVFSRSLSQ